jgi:hypothetical protein
MKILIIYTGGTIGMVQHPVKGTLAPVKFEQIEKEVPELNKFNYKIETIIFNPAYDSSNITPLIWQKIATTIEKHYNEYDGFVVLHGTDTMAYTASALSLSEHYVLMGRKIWLQQLKLQLPKKRVKQWFPRYVFTLILNYFEGIGQLKGMQISLALFVL